AGTGMQSVAALLTQAGVNLGTWTLNFAFGVSGNGQFITGSGIDPQGHLEAWLARIGPVSGLTTPASLQSSVVDLANGRQALMVHEHGLMAQLLFNNERLTSGTELGVFASAGSAEGGAYGRISYGNGLSILAALSYQEANFRNVRVEGAGF